jgi:hypothetical protein
MTGLVRDHPEVAAYLARLDAAAAGLPPDRRAELVESIEEHLTDALTAAGSDDAATVRAVLMRLGSPEDIVAVEPPSAAPPWAPSPAPSPVVAGASGWGPLEIAAVLLLSLGWVLCGVGSLAGLVLAWLSPRWTRREKVIATALGLLPVVLMAVVGLGLFAVGSTSSTEVGPVTTLPATVTAPLLGGQS